MKVKMYPKQTADARGDGFSAEEVKRGIPFLYMDHTCIHCDKLQSVANSNWLDGNCIQCGKKVNS